MANDGGGRRGLRGAVGLAAVLAAGIGGPTAADLREAPRPPDGPGFEGAVRSALREQPSVVSRPEHCSADPDRLRTIGRGAGQQVRVYREDGPDFALFTVSEARDEEPESIVRLGESARGRLGGAGEFPVRVLAPAPHPTLTDAEARRLGEFVERSDDDGEDRGLLVLAPHGGDIEPFTDRQAERVAAALAGKPVTTWRCLGWHPDGSRAASRRWHITATDLSEASFPRLAALSRRRYAHAVSFHGMSREGVLIGGAAPPELKAQLKAEIARALEGTDIPVTVAAEGDTIGGFSPRNIVNRYCAGTGIQVEQSSRARRDHWRAIADAVARFYAPRL